jgi:photosystem II stability/assembly factor-like uncharacterized protein
MIRLILGLIILTFASTGLKAQVWESTSGPRGSDRVNELHVGGDNSLFAVAGSLSRSTNAGDDWIMLLIDGLPIPARAMTIDSQGGMYVIASLFNTAEVLFSSDNGESWKRTAQLEDALKPIISLGSGILVASRSGTVKSIDSGKTWQACTEGRLLGTDAQGRLYASGQSDNGLVVSSNGGANWNNVACPPGRIINFSSTADDSYITINYHQVYRSKIGEFDWTPVPWGSQIYGFNISAARQNVIFAHAYGGVVYRSEDRGVSWTESSEGIPITAWINDLVTDRSDRLFFTMDRAVYRERLVAEVLETHANGISVSRSDNSIYLSGGEDHLGHEYTVEVYDVLGRRIANQSLPGSGSINLSDARQSVFVRVTQGSSLVLQRLFP